MSFSSLTQEFLSASADKRNRILRKSLGYNSLYQPSHMTMARLI